MARFLERLGITRAGMRKYSSEGRAQLCQALTPTSTPIRFVHPMRTGSDHRSPPASLTPTRGDLSAHNRVYTIDHSHCRLSSPHRYSGTPPPRGLLHHARRLQDRHPLVRHRLPRHCDRHRSLRLPHAPRTRRTLSGAGRCFRPACHLLHRRCRGMALQPLRGLRARR